MSKIKILFHILFPLVFCTHLYAPQIDNTNVTFQMICEEPWFSFIKQGIKPVEGRKNSPKYQSIDVGNCIEFINDTQHFKAMVTQIRRYFSLEQYLENVTIEKAVPGITSLEEAINIYHQWNTPEEIEQYGFLGIFIKVVE